ncbi:hypothetical protein ACFSCZ_11580 [Siminovitchia sediminis]|uniref:Uncharacterized protein n=1 Tax=Siminovitchia sediminis TaxID=1274353 RepID=A0ABW4KHF2_9BACI
MKSLQSKALLHQVDIQTDINLTDPYIEGEANQLKQVLINILKNAVESMPDGGKVHVLAENIRGVRLP